MTDSGTSHSTHLWRGRALNPMEVVLLMRHRNINGGESRRPLLFRIFQWHHKSFCRVTLNVEHQYGKREHLMERGYWSRQFQTHKVQKEWKTPALKVLRMSNSAIVCEHKFWLSHMCHNTGCLEHWFDVDFRFSSALYGTNQQSGNLDDLLPCSVMRS